MRWALLFLWACGETESLQLQTLELPLILPASGPHATLAQNLRKASQLALEDLSATEQLGALTLLALDESVVPAVARALKDRPLAIGPLTSATVLQLATYSEVRHTQLLSGTTTSPLLTPNPRWLRTAPSDGLQAAALASLAARHGQAACFYFDSEWSATLAERFHQTTVSLRGPRYAPLLIPYSDTATVPDSVAVVVVLGTELPAPLATLAQDSPLPWYGTEALQGAGLSGVRFDHESPYFTAFSARYAQRFGRPATLFEAQHYDATVLALLASARSPLDVRALSAGGATIHTLDFATAVRRYLSGEDVDFTGASGTVDLDVNGDVPGFLRVYTPTGDSDECLRCRAGPCSFTAC